jgi:cell division protein FtsB|tara:strand:- start:186 stop:464 length:279 start_codon:yes stop_codon:yes gene_type:complete
VKWVWALLVFILISLQVRLWVGEGSLAEVDALTEKIALQELENNKLRRRNLELLHVVRELRQGTEGIEEKARSDMGMIKDDETFFLYIPPEK